MSVLEVQRGFHEYTALHVHALALVLRCREEELPERHVARVQVYRTQAGRAVLFGDFEFDIVCPELDVDDGFAFHERLGYLTQCPTNLGTGMRASVMLHLPALRMTGVVNSIGANLSKLGLTMRGLYGESSKPAGAFYQLSNQVTLGISEKAAIDNLQNITTQLIAQEMRSRENLLNDIEVQDKIHRALGILKSAMLMDHSEAMRLLSLVRLGVSEKKLETLSTDSIDKLIVEIQPASIMTRYGDDMSPRDRDVKRAEILRDRFK